MMRALHAAAALLALGGASAAQSRLSWARYELQGPMSAPALELAPGSRTELEGALLAGERLERVLPVVVGALGPHALEPRWSWSGDPDHQGRARFLGWVAAADERWGRVPPGLRARPRPPVQPADTTPPVALFWLLGASALASLALARRGRFAPALPALGACALAWWLGAGSAAGAAQTWIVLEGQEGEAAWVELRAGWAELALPAEAEPLQLASDPEEAPISVATSLARPGDLRLSARGAALFAARVLEPGPGRIGADGQDCADFERVWWRAEGEWSFRGAWKRGLPLPGAASGEPPPGWLASGLPQGPRVCLGYAGGPSPRWFRQLGP
jgi:hypothetical protein